MGRFKLLFIAVLALLASAAPLHAQEPITATTNAMVQPETPRRLLFTAEASSSAGDLTAARLFFRPTGSTTRISEPVQFDPAPTVELSHEWQMQQNGTPPGAQIEYSWRLTDEAGNTFETPLQTIVALDPRFEWETIEDEELAIHWYDGNEAWGQEMFDTGRRAMDQLEEELGTDITRQVRLVAYSSGDDFRGAFPPQQDWIGGQAFPDLGVTVQIIGAGDDDWMETVLFHELSHLVFHQALEGALASPPSWLDEGLAMYNEPESRDSEARVRAAAEAGQLLPFSQLQGNFGAEGATVGLAYAQSQMMVAYLIEDCGEEGFQQIIQNMVDDMSVDAAMESACGYDAQTLYDDWRQTLPNPPSNSPTETDTAPDTDVNAPAQSGLSPLLVAFLVGGLCFVGLLGLAIVFIIIRLMRAQGGQA
jgi:hypothetical protein